MKSLTHPKLLNSSVYTLCRPILTNFLYYNSLFLQVNINAKVQLDSSRSNAYRLSLSDCTALEGFRTTWY